MFTEKDLRIDVANNYITNGTLVTNNNESIIICCHGLGGKKDNNMNIAIREYIVTNNLPFDTFRFNFYDENENTRSFLDATVESQVNDLNKIIKYFEPLYKNIYIIGASYGGLTIACLNSDKVTKQALIDPSFIIQPLWSEGKFIDVINNDDDEYCVTFHRNIPTLVNKKMREEGLNWNPEKSQQALDAITAETLIVKADTIHAKLLDSSLKLNNDKISSLFIKGADHSFNKLNTMNIMLSEVFNFIQK